MIRGLIKYLLRGILWGNTVLVANLLLVGNHGHGWMYTRLMDNFPLTILMFTILGIGIGTTTFIYNAEHLNVVQQTSIHLVISVSAFVVMGSVLGIMSTTTALSSIVQFIFIFAFVWVGFYLYEKDDIKKVNEKLKERNIEDILKES
jgi:hypothetical protein